MKGAIFDLDGVITDTAKFHFAAWSQLASEKLGLKLPASFETELKGISQSNLWNEFWTLVVFVTNTRMNKSKSWRQKRTATT